MKKGITHEENDRTTATTEEISNHSTTMEGDLTVTGQIRAEGEGGVGVINPKDPDAAAYLGFFENADSEIVSRIRLRGDGIGSDGAFQIQGTGDAVRLSVDPTGTTVNGTLDVKDNVNINGSLDVEKEVKADTITAEDKVTAPEFSGDLSGNADTASTLETPRKINGIPFDGSESITLPEQTDIKGNAGTAKRLQNARTISLIGGATGTVDFDGLANATINATVDPSEHTHTIAQIPGLQEHIDNIDAGGGHAQDEMMHVTHLSDNHFDASAQGIDYPMGKSIMNVSNPSGGWPLSWALLETINIGQFRIIQYIYETDQPVNPRSWYRNWRGNNERPDNNGWSNWQQVARHGDLPQPATTNPVASGIATPGTSNQYARANHVHPEQINISGNARTATMLQNSRMINGTSFNGEESITTANWGTGRNLTIGKTAKLVNGSGDVAWTLAEVGAASSTHGHSNATDAEDGFMSSEDKCKLDEIEDQANHYTHPTGDGNLHVPATGTTNNGRVLRSGATEGSLSWGQVGWDEITERPASFPPETHHHDANDINTGTLHVDRIPNINAERITSGTLPHARIPFGTGANDVARGNHTHPNVTNTTNGFMSSADKGRFDEMTPATNDPAVAGTATPGNSTQYARANHVHPAQTTITGNAGTATKLQTPRQINGTNFDGSANITTARWGDARTLTLTGAVTGSATIDGSEDVIINTTTTTDPSEHDHTIGQIIGLQDGLNNRSLTTHTHTAAQIGALSTAGGTLAGTLNARVVNSGNLRLNGANTIENIADTLNLNGGGAGVVIRNTGSHGGDLRIGQDSVGRRMWSASIYGRTYSRSANMCVTSAGTMGRSTSASKYKLNIKRHEEFDLASRILDLNVASWFDKTATESYAGYLTKKMQDDKVTLENEDIPPLKEHYGLIAEDVEAVGLGMYVDRDFDGEIEGIEYDRLWTLLIPLMKEQRQKIADLEARLDKLE